MSESPLQKNCVQAGDGVGHQYSTLLRNSPLDDTRPSNGLRFCCASKMLTASEAREPNAYRDSSNRLLAGPTITTPSTKTRSQGIWRLLGENERCHHGFLGATSGVSGCQRALEMLGLASVSVCQYRWVRTQFLSQLGERGSQLFALGRILLAWLTRSRGDC